MIQYQFDTTRLNGMPISTLCDWARTTGRGPGPVLPVGGPSQRLKETHPPGVIEFGPPQNTLVAWGLQTCAGVVLVSTDPAAPLRAVVYHALAGVLKDGVVAQMHQLLGGGAGVPLPIPSLLAVYAVACPWDPRYNAQAMKIENYGVPANQVVIIERVPAYGFGVNSTCEIGWC
jgi:hypothetical protein